MHKCLSEAVSVNSSICIEYFCPLCHWSSIKQLLTHSLPSWLLIMPNCICHGFLCQTAYAEFVNCNSFSSTVFLLSFMHLELLDLQWISSSAYQHAQEADAYHLLSLHFQVVVVLLVSLYQILQNCNALKCMAWKGRPTLFMLSNCSRFTDRPLCCGDDRHTIQVSLSVLLSGCSCHDSRVQF